MKTRGLSNNDAVLAEFKALKDEIHVRHTHQIQILGLLVTGLTALFALMFEQNLYWLALVIPPFTLIMGALYVSWQFGIKRIGEYISKVEKRTPGLGFEYFLKRKLHPKSAKEKFIVRFYPSAVSCLIVLPVIGGVVAFIIFVIQRLVCQSNLVLAICCLLVVCYLVAAGLVYKGLRIALWEYD